MTAWIDTLFDRWGKLAGLVQAAHVYQQSIIDDVETANGEFTDADRWMIDETVNGQVDAMVEAVDTVVDLVQAAAATFIIEMVNENATNPLTEKTIGTALQVLRDEMVGSDTVKQSDLGGGTVAYDAGNTGTASVDTSQVLLWQTEARQLIRPELIRLEVMLDRQASGTRGSELWRVRGEAALPNLHRDFPGGSGMDFIAQSAHGGIEAVTGPGGNLVTNGDLESFGTTDTADDWTKVVGTIGTTVKETATSCRGDLAWEWVGNGAELTEYTQAVSGLKPNTAYRLSAWLRSGVGVPASGVLHLALEDGAGTPLSGSSTMEQQLDFSSVTLTTTWTNYGWTLYTPLVIPEDAVVRIRLSTAIPAAQGFYLDEIVLTECYQPDQGAAPIAIVAGDVDAVQEDKATITWSRTAPGDGLVMLYLDKLHDLYSTSGFQLPDTGGTPSVLDSVIS